ncbi:MAG: glycosyltransferase, partial [Candidatus Omnitrophica bacterium]|nr:glycosyltransferase [Candidatus Omnitrophota bacterium]
MNTPPLITVAILNYNGLNLLKQNIPFILDLTYPNKEIIVLDNNSRDKSTAYLKTIKTITTLENKRNTGLSKGKNLLVKEAHGEFILLIDNDIQLP